MKYNDSEILQTVSSVVGRSLALNPEQVQPTSRLVNDLGMDSLDFLDIMFSLEKEFQAKLRDPEFDALIRPNKSEANSQKEFLEVEEIAKMQNIIPELASASVNGKIPRNQLFAFVTVDTLVRIVKNKLM